MFGSFSAKSTQLIQCFIKLRLIIGDEIIIDHNKTASYFEQFDKRKFFPDRTGRGANGKLRETETCVYIELAREIETSSWVLVEKGKCSKRHYKRLGFVYEVCISSLLLRFSKKISVCLLSH